MFINKEHNLSLNICNCLKGILACMILLCHLHGRVQLFHIGPLGGVLTSLGYLSVSMFFFLSGFGLTESTHIKTNYIKTFPNKKVLPFYLLCVFTILIYLTRDILVGNDFNVLLFVQSFLFGNTIIDNGWYLQVQLIFYLLFFLVFRFAKRRKVLILFAAISLYSLFCFAFGVSSVWFEAGLCFPLGIFYSENKDKIHSLIFKNKTKFIFSFLFFIVLFAIFYIFGNKPYLLDFSELLVKFFLLSCLCVFQPYLCWL